MKRKRAVKPEAPAKEYKPVDMTDTLHCGSVVYVSAIVDEIHNGNIMVKNDNGYYYNVTANDLVVRQIGRWEDGQCSCCGIKNKETQFCPECGSIMDEPKFSKLKNRR